MRTYKRFLLMILLMSLPLTEAWSSTADFLRALRLIQENPENTKAIESLLRKAFSDTDSTAERIHIAKLYLEISDEDQVDREAYLRFLIENAPSDTDDKDSLIKWKKLYADILFEKAEFASSEKLYLEIQSEHPQPSLIIYRLAWLNWNMKRYEKSLSQFHQILKQGDSSLATQTARDILGLLRESPNLWNLFLSELKKDPVGQKIFTRELLMLAKTGAARRIEQLNLYFPELSKLAAAQELSREFLSSAESFSKTACLFFDTQTLLPESRFDDAILLECLKIKEPSRIEVKNEFLVQRYQQLKNPKLIEWRVDLWGLHEAWLPAAQVLIRSDQINTENLRRLSAFIAKMTDVEREQFVRDDQSHLERWLKKEPSLSLVRYLQLIDFKTWFAFEEKYFESSPRDSEFSIGKLYSLVILNGASPQDSQVKDLLNQLSLEFESAKAAQQLMNEPSTDEESAFFNDELIQNIKKQIEETDRLLSKLQSSHPKLQAVMNRIAAINLGKKVENMRASILQSKVPEDLKEFEEAINQKKQALADGLLKKYASYLPERTRKEGMKG